MCYILAFKWRLKENDRIDFSKISKLNTYRYNLQNKLKIIVFARSNFLLHSKNLSKNHRIMVYATDTAIS